jgi:ADP-ribose pyrophosphatase YjhB (NUDIX family)
VGEGRGLSQDSQQRPKYQRFQVHFLKMNNTDVSDIVKVTAAMLVKDDKIIIAKRGPDDKLADKWEFPGGKIEINETPGQCLKREMKEEFDIDVCVGEYLGSSICHLN